jgi:hypothetical protein
VYLMCSLLFVRVLLHQLRQRQVKCLKVNCLMLSRVLPSHRYARQNLKQMQSSRNHNLSVQLHHLDQRRPLRKTTLIIPVVLQMEPLQYHHQVVPLRGFRHLLSLLLSKYGHQVVPLRGFRHLLSHLLSKYSQSSPTRVPSPPVSPK